MTSYFTRTRSFLFCFWRWTSNEEIFKSSYRQKQRRLTNFLSLDKKAWNRTFLCRWAVESIFEILISSKISCSIYHAPCCRRKKGFQVSEASGRRKFCIATPVCFHFKSSEWVQLSWRLLVVNLKILFLKDVKLIWDGCASREGCWINKSLTFSTVMCLESFSLVWTF